MSEHSGNGSVFPLGPQGSGHVSLPMLDPHGLPRGLSLALSADPNQLPIVSPFAAQLQQLQQFPYGVDSLGRYLHLQVAQGNHGLPLLSAPVFERTSHAGQGPATSGNSSESAGNAPKPETSSDAKPKTAQKRFRCALSCFTDLVAPWTHEGRSRRRRRAPC